MEQSNQYDVIIIGAGAAGLMCAIEAGKRGRKTAVLERGLEVGKKILISGGGRCNFTNKHISGNAFLSENPHFARSALSRYTQDDFIKLVEDYNIEYYEKKDGQLFCRDSAKQIVEMLLAECIKYGVSILTNTKITSVRKDDEFIVTTERKEFRSLSLVVATGGASIPKMGATRFGYEIAEQFGLRVIRPRPALVPLVWSDREALHFSMLSGVSFRGKVQIGETSFDDDILFTHRGLSGPAMLQISSYWSDGNEIQIDLLPNTETIFQERTHQKISTLLGKVLPSRLADRWCEEYQFDGFLDQCTSENMRSLETTLHHWCITPQTTEGFSKAEVTAGGVDTDELSSKTMEAKKTEGLYFIGEVVDVTGWLGGYNFQWAWSSGWASGQYV